MLLLCYPNCSTCKATKKVLDESKVTYEERNIKEDNPTYEELKKWVEQSQLPIKKFFNTSGVIYKEMELKDKLQTMSEDEKLSLLASNGMLVKRPLVVDNGKVLLGKKDILSCYCE